MKSERGFLRQTANVAGLLVTIAFHAACAALLQATWPPPGSAASAPILPRFALWVESESGPGADAWDRDPRALRSPVLFALPTAVGFSPPRRRHPEYMPTLSLPAPDDVLLERMPSLEQSGRLHARTTPEVSNALRTRWTGLGEFYDPFSMPPIVTNAIWTEWPDGAPEWIQGLPLSLNPPPASGERAWDAAAWIQVAESGEVTSVFLTRATADRERNDALVRALRALRAAPGRSGRYLAHVYYFPPPQDDRMGRGAP